MLTTVHTPKLYLIFYFNTLFILTSPRRGVWSEEGGAAASLL